MSQTPPIVKSVENARIFQISDDRVKDLQSGYQLIDPKTKGHVWPHKICLPSENLNVSCDVSSGTVVVTLFDRDGNLIGASKPLSGGLKIEEPIQWVDGVKIDKYVATPVSVKFELRGDAKLYALKFNNVFWD